MRSAGYSGWRAGLVTVALAAALVSDSVAHVAAQSTVRPEARAQTEPVPDDGDAADDPALWIHPQNPELSLVIATNKAAGLHTYNMDGTEHQVISEGVRPNNVDLLYEFPLQGQPRDIVFASARGKARGIKVWVMDLASRRLADVTQGGTIPVFGGSEPYGLCGYRSDRTGRYYLFVTNKDGEVEQHELTDAGGGRIGARKVRSFALGSIAEGCVADPELGAVYIGEEDVGVWRFDAEPGASGRGKLIARVGENGLVEDVEGIALYDAGGGRGYLIVSSQGNNTFKVYERSGENRYVLTIDPRDGRIDDVSDTDGIAVTNCPTSRQFGRGVFVVQDGENDGRNQNFKLYAWEDIAGTKLLTDTTCRVRSSES